MVTAKGGRNKEKYQGLQHRRSDVPVARPIEEIDRLFESVFPRGWMRPFRWGWPAWNDLVDPLERQIPRVDVIDRDEDILLRAEAPGVDREDFDVSVTDDSVTIRGSSRHEEEESKGEFFRREISTGNFARTIALPATVDSSRAEATFKDGILEIRLPKQAKAKRRNIEIK